MSLAYKILASFLLICCFSLKGAGAGTDVVVKWGALDRVFHLEIKFNTSDTVDNIRWKIPGNIVQFKKSIKQPQTEGPYKVFEDGTLEIKRLARSHSGHYLVEIFDAQGKGLHRETYELKVLEAVSKPDITWHCENKTLICNLVNGTHAALTLKKNEIYVKNGTIGTMSIGYEWKNHSQETTIFNCTASNNASSEDSIMEIVTGDCPVKRVDIYLIIGICGGGILLLVFVVLVIIYISKRRKRNSRRDEEEERREPRVTAKDGGPMPHQIPGSASPNPALLQPPPPARRSQAAGLRPPPPGPRGQHQQQKRPLPHPGAQGPQQKGPPLPRPRVCPKPPHGAADNF
ncbi:T-cell surface antigen CD2 isoform X2 [Talpa occidentalis]|uniref:T-cell surface antigen CD2 isoform X2 n=1 Tax=Talpa occidentalis TaxID=50954 RepID=UPI00189068CC|nr:T-cell surface antigen CD2 isoform X2 [Talpa occidentalis]